MNYNENWKVKGCRYWKYQIHRHCIWKIWHSRSKSMMKNFRKNRIQIQQFDCLIASCFLLLFYSILYSVLTLSITFFLPFFLFSFFAFSFALFYLHITVQSYSHPIGRLFVIVDVGGRRRISHAGQYTSKCAVCK